MFAYTWLIAKTTNLFGEGICSRLFSWYYKANKLVGVKVMDLQHLKEIISVDNVEINLFLSQWQNENVFSVCPTIGNDFKDDIKGIVLNQLNFVEEYNQVSYNIVGNLDEELECVSCDEYRNKIDSVLNSLQIPNKDFDFDPDSFDFFIYSFENPANRDQKAYFFRRTRRFRTFKKGFLGHIIEGKFRKLNVSDLLGTDDKIDFVMMNNEVIILQHISFERVFHLHDEFITIARNVLSNPVFPQKIENFDELMENALNNGNYIKRLSKLVGSNTATLFLNDMQETRNVIQRFNLDIEIQDNKIIYSDISQLGNFINLMQDAYYQTLIGKEDGVDARRPN